MYIVSVMLKKINITWDLFTKEYIGVSKMEKNNVLDENKEKKAVKNTDDANDKTEYQKRLKDARKKKREKIRTLIGACVVVIFLIFWFTHPHRYGEWTMVQEPGCVENGLEERKCFCGHAETKEIPDLGGHVEVVDEEVKATCLESGLTEGSHCSVCDEVLVTQNVVDALGHAEEKMPAVEATCIQEGLTEGVKCSRCEVVLVEQESIEQTEHKFKKNVCEICKIKNFVIEIEEIELIYVDKVPAVRCVFAPQAYINTEEYDCTLKFKITSKKVNATHESKMKIDVNKVQEFVLKISGATPANEDVKVTVEIYDGSGNVLDKDTVTKNWKKS